MGWTFTKSSAVHFDRIIGLGLGGKIFGWTGLTGLLFEAKAMDGTRLDLTL